MEATRGNGYAPAWGSLVMMMMMIYYVCHLVAKNWVSSYQDFHELHELCYNNTICKAP